MRLTKVIALAGLAIAMVCGSGAHAAPLQWQIDSTQSSVKMVIPDQKINLNGANTTLRVRNNNNTTWTTNVAPLAGSLNTDFVDGQSIQFLNNPLGQFIALNSGSYRPNPAVVNPANTNLSNPDGQFEDASTAPAVLGGVLRSTTAIPEVVATLGYMSLVDMSWDATSGVIPLAGTNFSSQLLWNVQSTLIIDGTTALGEQYLPDGFGAIYFGQTSPTLHGTITSPDPINQPYLRQLTLPFSTGSSQTDIYGAPITTSFSGTIVAYAMVPEPSSALLAGLGAAALFALGYRRRKQ